MKKLTSVIFPILLSACGGGDLSHQSSSSARVSTSGTSESEASVTSEKFLKIQASGVYLESGDKEFSLMLGAQAVEDQYCIDPNSHRIQEVYNTDLEKYVFRFELRMEDIDCATRDPDRQRLEVKAYAGSSEITKSFQNDTAYYSWLVHLPYDFKVSESFTHLFQIKPVGGNDGMPLISLTARKVSSGNRLELLHSPADESERLAEVPLDKLLGKWLQIKMSVHYSHSGNVELTITDNANGYELFHYMNSNANLWRDGTDFNRPKWGIYRSLKSSQDLRDEVLFYDGFCIAKSAGVCF